MVNIDALMNVLPGSNLEPHEVARIEGLTTPRDGDYPETDYVYLWEPPVGQTCPYVDPQHLVESVLQSANIPATEARAAAIDAVQAMQRTIPAHRWVTFFDDIYPDSDPRLPISAVIAWWRDADTPLEPKKQVLHIPADLDPCTQLIDRNDRDNALDFLEKAADITSNARIFPAYQPGTKWSLSSAPTPWPANAMIEFVPGPPWSEIPDSSSHSDAILSAFREWREAMMPIADRLKEDLGEPVYYFKKWDDDLDDDYVHRFLVLHVCCVLCPKSRYVRYLTEISGATDVHELKAALLNPASYTAPYQMKPVMDSYEPLRCVFDYSKNTGKHRATFVTYSEAAADTVSVNIVAR